MKYGTVKKIEQTTKNYFQPRELECPCCRELILDVRLLYILNVIRQFTGVPVIVTSGYRCHKHNKAEGGEPQSYHLYGQAADIYAPFMPIEEFWEKIKLMNHFNSSKYGFIYYPDRRIVHVDCRGKAWRDVVHDK